MNEAEEHVGVHGNINENEQDENTFSYVSYISVFTEGSDLIGSDISSRPVDRLEPTSKG